MAEKRARRMLEAMDPRRDAFVIWLDTPPAATAPGREGDREGVVEAATPAEPLCGRVEHVQSSARASFASLAELLVFLEGHRSGKPTPEGEG